MLSFSLKSLFLLKQLFNSCTYSVVVHFSECLPTPAQCLINYWTLKNLWEAKALCDWAADMKKRYSPEYLTDRNRRLIRQYKHRVNDGNTMKYLHAQRRLWCGGRHVGFYRFLGWAWSRTTNPRSMILKAMWKKRERERERKRRKRKTEKGMENIDL